MRQALAGVLIVVFIALGVRILQEHTQYQVRTLSSGDTSVTFTVATHEYAHDRDFAATTLWNAGISQLGWQRTTEPRSLGRSAYVAVLFPAVPHSEERRLKGCLEDLIVDKVKGHVTATVRSDA
jgi:hypothetical protein